MQNLAVIGLPLAIAIDVIIQFILLLVFLKFKIKEIRYKNLFIFFVKVLGATILAMVVAYIARQIFGGFLGSSRFIILLFQTAIAGGLGFLSYMAVGRFMKFPEIESFRNFILSQVGFLNLKKKI